MSKKDGERSITMKNKDLKDLLSMISNKGYKQESSGGATQSNLINSIIASVEEKEEKDGVKYFGLKCSGICTDRIVFSKNNIKIEGIISSEFDFEVFKIDHLQKRLDVIKNDNTVKIVFSELRIDIYDLKTGIHSWIPNAMEASDDFLDNLKKMDNMFIDKNNTMLKDANFKDSKYGTFIINSDPPINMDKGFVVKAGLFKQMLKQCEVMKLFKIPLTIVTENGLRTFILRVEDPDTGEGSERLFKENSNEISFFGKKYESENVTTVLQSGIDSFIKNLDPDDVFSITMEQDKIVLLKCCKHDGTELSMIVAPIVEEDFEDVDESDLEQFDEDDFNLDEFE